MNNSLAIVIPAYKIKYFDAALSSVAAQTNKNFKVYVSDDGSKEDIKSLVDKYAGKINIQYHRFTDNLGRHDLVKQWNRSVSLAAEKWIWLFSDDDTMQAGCVQAFFNALDKTKNQHDVYRFNIKMIDAEDRVICVKELHPIIETGYEFLQRRLQSKSLSAAVEYIFRKDVFDRNGGFVNFPLAFCSDDASWIQFAANKPIYTIPEEKVYWRASNVNISSTRGLQHEKIDALLKYCLWVIAKFKDTPLPRLEEWFFENLKYVYGKLGIVKKYALAKKLSELFHKKWFFYWTKLVFDGTI